jgi:hypothetical protein
VKGWLIDTNVFSELRKPKPSQRVRAFLHTQPGRLLFTAEANFAEVRFGIAQIADALARANLARWLDAVIRPMFVGRTLAHREETLLQWRMMMEAGRRKGHTFSEPDLMIAAVAAREELVVVSRDIDEYVAAEVPVLDPWKALLHARGRAHSMVNIGSADMLPRATALLRDSR